MADLGLRLKRVTRQFDSGDGNADVIYDCYSLTTDRLLLPEIVATRVTHMRGNKRKSSYTLTKLIRVLMDMLYLHRVEELFLDAL